jgi:membrane protein implicated in regulation of membrane protease activity
MDKFGKTLKSWFTTLKTLSSSKPLAFDANHSFLQAEAEVDEMIQPGRSGRVKLNGSWWAARCEQNMVLTKGTIVRVVGIQKITLLVEPTMIPLID